MITSIFVTSGFSFLKSNLVNLSYRKIIESMEAINYETLIRNVFNSNRTLVNGADADIYREMSVCYRELEVKSMLKSQDEREVDYQKAFVPVRRYIYNAVLTAKEYLESIISKEHKSLLEGYLLELNMRFFNKERLDEIIEETNNIYYLYKSSE